MTIKTYKSKTNPDLGFAIQESNGEISLWVDEFEGGEAYQDDFTYVDDFKTILDAQDYIYQTYGEVELLDTY
jgi:hypothetical protein